MAANPRKNKAVSRAKPGDSLKLKFVKPKAFVFLLSILVLLIIYLQSILWLGDGSLAEVRRLKKSLAQIEKENAQLQVRNQQLIDEVEALRDGFDLIEHRAREDLGLVKKNEVFYHLIDHRSEEEKKPSNQ